MANVSTQSQNAKDKVKDNVTNIADKAGDLAQKAMDKGEQLASTAGDKADSAVESVGSGMKSLAGTIKESLPEKGMIGEASQSVAGALESGGRYLEEKGLSGLSADVTDLIKRNPIPAVLLALGLGYLIAASTRRS